MQVLWLIEWYVSQTSTGIQVHLAFACKFHLGAASPAPLRWSGTKECTQADLLVCSGFAASFAAFAAAFASFAALIATSCVALAFFSSLSAATSSIVASAAPCSAVYFTCFFLGFGAPLSFVPTEVSSVFLFLVPPLLFRPGLPTAMASLPFPLGEPSDGSVGGWIGGLSTWGGHPWARKGASRGIMCGTIASVRRVEGGGLTMPIGTSSYGKREDEYAPGK